MQVQTEEEEMQTTSHFRCVVATIAVLVVGALTLGASAGVAAQHQPKLGLAYPSQAAGDAVRGVRHVQIRDAKHMALIENARRHGLNVQNVKPIGSRQFYVPTPATASKVIGSDAFGWTYPGVLAGLSLAFALVVGGLVVAARRRLGKSRTVTA